MAIERPVFIPESEDTLIFQGYKISTADLKDGKGYVSIRSLCDVFRLDQRAQRRRLLRQRNYFESFTAKIKITTPGGPQPSLCLRASAESLFLTDVDLGRISNPETRLLLLAFLGEAHTVLAEHFGSSEHGEVQFLRDSFARMVSEQALSGYIYGYHSVDGCQPN